MNTHTQDSNLRNKHSLERTEQSIDWELLNKKESKNKEL